MRVGKENEKLEFKKSTSELREGVISIAAILNKHGGGELYFGVHNNGMPLGQMIGESTLRDISQAVSNHLEPKVYPKIAEAVIENKRCICVAFTGDKAPYFAYGRAYIRVADEDKQMSAAELEAYIIRKNSVANTWDSQTSDKTIDYIDESVLKEYHEYAHQAGRIAFPYTTKEDVLTRLNMLKEGKLKNAAVMLFCGEPLMELQMAIFATTERLTFNDINREGGSVRHQAAVAERYVRNNIRWRVVFDGSLQRNEIPEIPVDALREAIINSYCHRDYKSSQNNEVVIYSNRVEIYNPGAFPSGYTPQDFIEGVEPSVKRNPLIAQLMYYVKDIESFGTGLKRISDECEAAGVKVEFHIRKRGFAVIFYRPEGHNGDNYSRKDVTNDGDDVIKDVIKDDSDAISNVNDIENMKLNIITTSDVAINVVITEREKQVIRIISENKSITADRLAVELRVAQRTIQRYLKALQDKNVITRAGSRKTGHWELK